MGAEVDPLIVKLKADIDEYQAKITGAQRLTDQKLDLIEKRGFSMGQNLKKGFNLAQTAAAGYLATLGIGEVIRAASAGLEYASALGEQAQQLGVTTAALQEYRYAATQVGLSTEETDQALSQLTRRIGEAANGTKAQAEAFATLGISVKDANGEVLNAGEAIPLIADALERIESPAQRAAILMDLFGRAGQKLEPLLSGGASAVNGLRDAAHSLGIVLSEKQIQDADNTADKLSKLKLVLEAKIAGAVADNVDGIMKLADALTDLVDSLGNAGVAYGRFQRAMRAGGDFVALINPLASVERKGAAARDLTRLRGEAREAEVNNMLEASGLTIPRLLAAPKSRTGSKFVGGSLLSGGNLDASVGYAPGRGAKGVAALLAVNPGAAVKAVTKMTADLQQLAADIASAEADLSGNLERQAAARKQSIDAELAGETERLKADTSITAAKRDELVSLHQRKASIDKQLVDQRLSEDLARQKRDADQKALNQRVDALDSEARALDAEAAITTNVNARNAIEQRILAIQQEEERARLEAAIAAGDIADAAQARANLERKQAADRTAQADRNLSPAGRYAADLRAEAENIDAAFESAAVNGLQRLNDSLGETVKKTLGLHGILGDIIGDFIQIAIRQALIRPLAESLGGGGGLGGFFSLVGRALGAVSAAKGTGAGYRPARASGGYVGAGQVYRVNEGASPGRVEGFSPLGSGQIIPLGQMNALRSRGSEPTVIRVHVVEGTMFEPRVEAISGRTSVEVVRAAAPAIADAATRQTFAKAGRAKL